jgi:teichuronic acid biosynthesis glycosyltransferase TuaG
VMLPKVSIIIPTYNRAHYLPVALQSALNQTYPNIEVLVINDGSTDNTEDILTPYRKSIRYDKHENRGLAATKNRGIELASGEFICNLDDDDRFHPEKVARQVEMFHKHPNLGICGTGAYFVDGDGQLIEPYMPPRFTRKTQLLQLLRRCLLVQSSVMIRKTIHEHLGGYKLMLSEDYEFWCRVSRHYDIGCVEEYLTDYRQHGAQITGPETRPQLMAAVAQLIKDFIEETPMEELIPQLQSPLHGYALIGMLLCGQKLFDLSESYLKRVRPDPISDLGFGFLRFRQKRFLEAKTHLQSVQTSNSPLALKAAEALHLIDRADAVSQTSVHNLSPEVVQLRKEISCLYASIIQQLLRLAKGEKR